MKPTLPNSKVAIVTGSSRGIGAAVARRLAADGFIVVVNYAGRAADAEAVVIAIESAGGRAAAQGTASENRSKREIRPSANWGHRLTHNQVHWRLARLNAPLASSPVALAPASTVHRSPAAAT